MLKKSMVIETLKLLVAKRFVFAIEGAPSHYYNLKKPDEVVRVEGGVPEAKPCKPQLGTFFI